MVIFEQLIHIYFHCLPIDLCTQFSTSTKRRGHFTWPQTSIGYRRNVRCPYDVTGGHYGYVDCNYSNITGPSRVAWGTPVTKHCPEPPLTEVIKRLKTELSQVSKYLGLYTCIYFLVCCLTKCILHENKQLQHANTRGI